MDLALLPSIQILSMALGVACLAGVNLYLTTFLAGLAVRLGWLAGPGTENFAFLGHPALMTVALILFLLEAVADKIPWIDSLWDAIHTVIRPAGAVLLTQQIFHSASPDLQIAAAVLAGGAALTTHLTKSGLRLLVNASPEPFSNILVSLAEDGLVTGLLFLTISYPMAGLAACLTLLVCVWIALPRLFRLIKASVFLMWKKLRLPGYSNTWSADTLPSVLSADHDMLVCEALGSPDCAPVWAVRAVSGQVRGLKRPRQTIFGTLVSVREHPAVLVFLERRWFRRQAVKLNLPGCEIRHDSAFLSENLVIYSKAEKTRVTFRFPRAEARLAARLAEDLLRRLGRLPPEPEPASVMRVPVIPISEAAPLSPVTPPRIPPIPAFPVERESSVNGSTDHSGTRDRVEETS